MTRVVLAANNAEVGGGEVMLLATASLLRDLGEDVTVVGPDAADGVLDRAAAAGFAVERLAPERRRYAHELRAWHARRDDLLWCHGLVPALATSGRPRRIVHLHQLPTRAHRAALLAARSGATRTLVPSRWLSARVPRTVVLPNWTPEPQGRGPEASSEPGPPSDRPRLGFLGRHTVAKGLVVLAEALHRIPEADRPVLVLAGAPRFTDVDGEREVAAGLERLGDGVERVGWVSPGRLLGDVDALVVPSVAPESFGLAALEAMAAGVPVVVSDAGALPEVVGPQHPFVATAGDAGALADRLEACLAQSASTRSAVVAAQRHRWREEYSPHTARDRVAAVVRDASQRPA
ncbi:glycosyltransferase family 4 protein [Phycicoccus sp. CSK15P-2]|uniref:glycosyltransferase family 4 protein n=1 Tax=Phycicoccus sp. CSK15P-2 TaxID=2807627 RepID=UPI00194F6BFA|nr:glycosyltransferase family 4 protein [Phycicoccus sp. CSK15P-2]MBM6404317.1 glycosyltransferase family 4 protein [Phycicoccus sp. CSK15P-2]